MFGEYQIEIIDLNDKKIFKIIRDFLSTSDLSFENTAEYTIAVKSNGKLAGTGSFTGEVLHNIAVDENLRGTGLTSLILSKLIQEEARRGRMHYFIYTKASKAHVFANLGFTEIARSEPYAALLETGLGSVRTFCKAAAKSASHLPPKRASVVINGDPFTRGDQSLIQKAAHENEGVIVFVISEEKSLFPFDRTMELVKVGVADLANVVVISSGPYIVTSTTFPSYFTSRGNRVTAQTRLDCSLFASQIAPGLGITTRYVIEEPCPVTNAYHEAMKEIFPKHRIDLRVMRRTQADGEIISASKVRDMIRHGDWEGIKEAVPETTYRYLVSPEARNILDEIIHSSPRH